jgi:hypothetical protein
MKTIRNLFILLSIIVVVTFFFYLYANQSFVKFGWCEDCNLPGARVDTTSCQGLKLGDKEIVKKCQKFPI